jgi:hypothetical protein
MKPADDLTGQRFGLLTVISFAGGGRWSVRCDCGNESAPKGHSLKSGHTTSCGCKRRLVGRSSTTHGMHATRTYSTWLSMNKRCHDQNNPSYGRYGGSGIAVCQKWRDSFEAFYADMGERPAGTSLDRYPNKQGNYEPGNCRWATLEEQGRNKTNNAVVAVGGIEKCVAEWAKLHGISRHVVRERLRLGWTPERAFTTPVQSRSKKDFHVE